MNINQFIFEIVLGFFEKGKCHFGITEKSSNNFEKAGQKQET